MKTTREDASPATASAAEEEVNFRMKQNIPELCVIYAIVADAYVNPVLRTLRRVFKMQEEPRLSHQKPNLVRTDTRLNSTLTFCGSWFRNLHLHTSNTHTPPSYCSAPNLADTRTQSSILSQDARGWNLCSRCYFLVWRRSGCGIYT